MAARRKPAARHALAAPPVPSPTRPSKPAAPRKGTHTKAGMRRRQAEDQTPRDPFQGELVKADLRPARQRPKSTGPARGRFGAMPRQSPTDLAGAYPGARSAEQDRRRDELMAELLQRQAVSKQRQRESVAHDRGVTLRKATYGGKAGRTEAGHRAELRQKERDRAEFDRIVDRELRAKARGATASAVRGGRAGAQLVRETNAAVTKDRAERARTVASAARSGTLKGRRAAGVRAGREAVRNARRSHGQDPNEPLNLTHTRTIQQGKGKPRTAAPIPHKGEAGPQGARERRAGQEARERSVRSDTLNLNTVPKQRDPLPGESKETRHWFFR